MAILRNSHVDIIVSGNTSLNLFSSHIFSQLFSESWPFLRLFYEARDEVAGCFEAQFYTLDSKEKICLASSVKHSEFSYVGQIHLSGTIIVTKKIEYGSFQLKRTICIWE